MDTVTTPEPIEEKILSTPIETKVEKSTELATVSKTESVNTIQESIGKDAEVIIASTTTEVPEEATSVLEKTLNEGNSIVDTVVSGAGVIIEAGENLANAISSMQ